MRHGTMTPIHRALAATALLLTACGGEPDTDTTDDVIEEPAASPSLREGRYEATAVTFDDGCGGSFADTPYLPVVLAWTSDTEFELRYDEGANVSTIACTLDGTEAATCGGFHQEISIPDPPVVELLDSVTHALNIQSERRFEIVATWTLTCEGDECDAHEASLGYALPCSVETSATFAK